MSIKEQIGQRLLIERKAKGLTRKALSELTDDIKQSRINNYERGYRTPGPEEIKQLSKALDISAAYLMCLTDDKNSDKPKTVPGLRALIPFLNLKQAAKPKAEIDKIKSAEDASPVTFLPISNQLAKHAGGYSFAIQMNDDSMSPELLNTDILIVDPDINVQPSDMVLAEIEGQGEVVVRRFKQLSAVDKFESYELLANNANWPNIKVSGQSKTKIIGVVLTLIRNVKA